MILTLMVQNLKTGGIRDSEGNAENRWPMLLKRILSVNPKPDLLLITEAVDWNKFGHRYLSRAMNDLNMDALPLAPSSSGYGVGIMYNQKTLGRWQRWNADFASDVTHGFGVASFDVGLPNMLSIATAHLNPFSSDKALQEISLIANRAYRYGQLAVIGGDLNYPPSRGPEPDYENMLPYNTAARTALTDPAKNMPLAPDRRIGWKLEQAGFVDVAYHMYEKTGNEKYLERTATDDRIDQFWVSKPLATGIVDYWVMSESQGASDHKGIVFQLDTDKINTSGGWDYR